MHEKAPEITPGLTQMSVSNLFLLNRMHFIVVYSFASDESSYVNFFAVGLVVGRLGERVPVLATQAQA